jgi:hypothetical protein
MATQPTITGQARVDYDEPVEAASSRLGLGGRGEDVAGGGMVDAERREAGKVVRESRGSG